MTETQPKKQIRYASRDSSTEILLRMEMRDALGYGERDVYMPREAVTRYYSGDDKTSVMETAQGEKIYVALPLEALRAKLSERRPLIDLRKVTGGHVLDHIIDKNLSGLFNMVAIRDDLGGEDMVILMDGYRKSDLREQDRRRIAFLKSEILEQKSESGTIFLKMESWKQYSGNWDMDNLGCGPYLKMPREEFNRKIDESRAASLKLVNFCEDTDLENGSAFQDVRFSAGAARLRRK